ncbi:DUF5004 domain-containing protein [Anaerophaga thermohalophila]|uniref:DUF5004 domain-containing protein n=1 Tax=Anaerophaga thermohalophila TaxID=177400 RepID=UPI000237B8B2|nr:DUF5004 domain-containing protein [Anaerophaga thermohalophila]
MKRFMKRLMFYLVFLTPGLIFLPGCNETEDGSFVEPITLYEKVNGTWGLKKLVMIDNYAKANTIEPSEQEISSYFNFEEMEITLNVDEDNNPTTFAVSGDVPALFLTEGYWELSSPFPTTDLSRVKINLYSDSGRQNKVDELELTTIPGARDEMSFELVRRSDGVAFLTYSFSLSLTDGNQ